MSDDIPFDKNLDLAPDTVDEPMPGVRRIMANNPGPFTFKGTVSYIVGHGNVAIIDPGPDDPAHIGALLDAVRGETVSIFSSPTRIGIIRRRCRPSRRPPAPPSMQKGRTGRRGRCTSANSTRSMPAPIATFVPISLCGRRARQRRWLDHRGRHDAGPHRQSHGLCAQGKKLRCLPAIMSWAGRPRSSRRRTAP